MSPVSLLKEQRSVLSRSAYRNIAIVTVMLLAFALRTYGLTNESLWIDEGYSVALADHGLADIVRGTIADQHPPLYYVLLHLWQYFGDTVYHIRYLSVLLGMLGLAAILTMVNSLFGTRVGLTATLLSALSPMHIWYSQEARMYILLTLLTTLSAYYFWRLARGEKRVWAPYLLVTALSLYTHNYAVFIIVAENLLVGVWLLLQRRSLRFLARWVVIQLSVLLVYGAWIPVVLYQARHHQMRWLGSPNLETLRGTLDWLLLGQTPVRPVNLVWLLLAAIGVVLLARSGTVRPREGIEWVLGWFLLPLGLAFVVSQRYPIFQAKQFLIVLPALTAGVAVALCRLQGGWRWLIAGVLLAYNTSGLLNEYRQTTKHEWREVAAHITSHLEEGDVLYLNPAASILVLDVYLPDDVPYAGYPPGYSVIRGGWEGVIVDASMPEIVLAPLAEDYDRIWLVEFSPGFWDPNAHLAAWLRDRARPVDALAFHGISVRLFDVRDVVGHPR